MRHTTSRWCLILALALGAAVPIGDAHAADAVAESMFQQALTMMREGNFDGARQALEASHKLEPRSGTLLVLGSCNEQLGRTASAWAQYKDAAGMARAEGRTDHVTKATELAKALEPRLAKLRIDGQLLQGGVQVMVKLDGVVVIDGQLGVAFAIDPGEHRLTASAPGRADWSSTIKVEPGKESQIVAIPELEMPAELKATPPVQPPVPPPPPSSEPATDSASDSGGGVGPAWAWIVGGTGIVLGGIAIGFGVDQQAVSGELNDRCGELRADCPSDYDFDGARAREVRDFGLFLGLGIGALGAVSVGVIGLVLDGGDESKQSVWLDVGPTSASIVGRF